jgi:hypothetical protein
MASRGERCSRPLPARWPELESAVVVEIRDAESVTQERSSLILTGELALKARAPRRGD